MYNKISSIILNSGKGNGLNDVYVAQPDTTKEGLAGKVFLLAEISGKKSDGQKIFDFLIDAVEDNYYNDEKILLRDKVEGLKIENIFEAAITKINKQLNDFLIEEKIKIVAKDISITLGVVYDDKLHFSCFGRNRALLVYKHGNNHEIINVEANAADVETEKNTEEGGQAKAPKIFSSVISGEIPVDSYFIFANEALPEYLSGQEMIKIVTKLSPMAAAEQIKNILSAANTFVPFLGIIIKNTSGFGAVEPIDRPEENLSSASRDSSLEYTEQRTEEMLAPAGLINFSKILKKIKKSIKKAADNKERTKKNNFKSEHKEQPVVDFGVINNLNLARADSFLIKEKIFLKRSPGRITMRAKAAFAVFADFLRPSYWSGLFSRIKIYFNSLNKKNRFLFSALGILSLVFITSIFVTHWNQRREEARARLNELVLTLEEKENLIDSHLLYNDNEGAGIVLSDAQALLESLPRKTKEEQAAYEELLNKLKTQEEKVQKIIRFDSTTSEKVNDLAGMNINNLVFAGNQVYAANDSSIYALTPNSSFSVKTDIDGAAGLFNPHKNFNVLSDLIHYWGDKYIAEFDFKTKKSRLIRTENLDSASSLVSFKIYNKKLYSIAKDNNQIYVYSDRAGFSSKTDWLKETADLSKAADLGIDGSIYVLNSDGSVLKFNQGKTQEYKVDSIFPAITSADKIIVGINYIYIFEKESKRLIAFSKEKGELFRQYIVESLGGPTDVAVDEFGKAAYFLDNEAVYRIKLE